MKIVFGLRKSQTNNVFEMHYKTKEFVRENSFLDLFFLFLTLKESQVFVHYSHPSDAASKCIFFPVWEWSNIAEGKADRQGQGKERGKIFNAKLEFACDLPPSYLFNLSVLNALIDLLRKYYWAVAVDSVYTF